jgi:hypothetical protein
MPSFDVTFVGYRRPNEEALASVDDGTTNLPERSSSEAEPHDVEWLSTA